MAKFVKVLIVGHSKETVASLEPILRKHPDVKSASRLLTNGTVDPLHGVRDIPDVLMLELSQNWEDELQALNIRPAAQRPKVIAAGASDDARVLRRAMQMGVRDFLNIPIDPHEVIAALQNLVDEKRAIHSPVSQRITAVFNAKGGSGASFLASNLSHIMVQDLKLRVALVDLDLQFGTSALCLNLHPKVGIGDALFSAADIDTVALQGYMSKHESGLDVLASTPHGFVAPSEVSTDQLDHLLQVVASSYDHVVIDLPRIIDALTLSVMAKADRIVLVLQQYLSHLHDAKRFVQGLRGQFQDLDERLVIAINRFHNKASVSTRDIEQGLGCRAVFEIPNDYKRVSVAEDLGVPLFAHAPSAPVTKSLRQFAQSLSGVSPPARGLFKRMFSDSHQTQ